MVTTRVAHEDFLKFNQEAPVDKIMNTHFRENKFKSGGCCQRNISHPTGHGCMSELDRSTTSNFQIFVIHGVSNFWAFCTGPAANFA
jgi:hypothetical protein